MESSSQTTAIAVLTSRALWFRVTLAATGVAAVVAAVALVEGGLRVYLAVRYPAVATKDVNHDLLGDYFRPGHRYSEPSHVEGLSHELATNELGIVDRPSLASASDLTVMMLGDSMLEGAQVAPEGNLSELFAGEIEGGCRCVNLGHGGDSPVKYLLAYRHFKQHFDADLVLVFFYAMNDFNDDARLYHDGRIVFDEGGDVARVEDRFDLASRTYWTKWAGVQPFTLKQHWVEASGLISLEVVGGLLRGAGEGPGYGPREPLGRRSGDFEARNIDLVRNNIMSAFKDRYAPEDMEDIRRTQRYLLDLDAEVKADGAQMAVVMQPFAGQLEGGISPLEGAYFMDPDEVANALPQETMATFLSAQGMPFLDLLPRFRELGQSPLFGEKNKHLTEDGHQVVAAELQEFLSHTFDLIPAPSP